MCGYYPENCILKYGNTPRKKEYFHGDFFVLGKNKNIFSDWRDYLNKSSHEEYITEKIEGHCKNIKKFVRGHNHAIGKVDNFGLCHNHDNQKVLEIYRNTNLCEKTL